MNQLLYVPFEGSDGIGASVILNGKTIYHEDDEPGYTNESVSAQELSKRLAKALGIKARTIRLKVKDVPEAWNFDDVEAAALKKASKAK